MPPVFRRYPHPEKILTEGWGQCILREMSTLSFNQSDRYQFLEVKSDQNTYTLLCFQFYHLSIWDGIQLHFKCTGQSCGLSTSTVLFSAGFEKKVFLLHFLHSLIKMSSWNVWLRLTQDQAPLGSYCMSWQTDRREEKRERERGEGGDRGIRCSSGLRRRAD